MGGRAVESLPSAKETDAGAARLQDRNERHYALVAQAIRYLRDYRGAQPSLEDLAHFLGVSESHLQRVFSAWAGLSPQGFLQVITRDAAVSALREGAAAAQARLRAGRSGPARLHETTIACAALTPGEPAADGAGLRLRYGWSASPFGRLFAALTERGICSLSFHDAVNSDALAELHRDWPRATLVEDAEGAQALADTLFAKPCKPGTLHLLLQGTHFQVQVWRALLRVSAGQLISYRGLAELSGHPRASRAVGSAMARNRIAYLIPCHRVIREDGNWGSYRWGLERKLALRGWELGAIS